MLLYKGFPSNFCQVRFRLDRLENKRFLTQSYSVIILVCLKKSGYTPVEQEYIKKIL